MIPKPAPVQRLLVPGNEDTRMYFSRTELAEKAVSPVAVAALPVVFWFKGFVI